jgi:predicted MFS family arabinose efflux permease
VFVGTLGIVNLFADMTYEGARAVTGPFLGSLGASAAVVGFVAGLGELLGYVLRSISGYFADRTGRYWVLIFSGYAINMLAVPALALAGDWPIAAAFIVAERTGRAIRRPSVEALIAGAGDSIGQGWVFGLNEALDQTGATIGPLITALVLYAHGGYDRAFAFLLSPALLCLGALVAAKLLYPDQASDKRGSTTATDSRLYPKTYWLYAAAGACFAAGFADFSLIAFHFRKVSAVDQALIPVLYSVAMAVGAITSLVPGHFLDRVSTVVALVSFSISACSAPLVFLGHSALIGAGVCFWGIGLGAQDSIIKALLARVVHSNRGTAFGLFDTIFGASWFVGSAAMGLLYANPLIGLVALSTVLQVVAVPPLWMAMRDRSGDGRE